MNEIHHRFNQYWVILIAISVFDLMTCHVLREKFLPSLNLVNLSIPDV